MHSSDGDFDLDALLDAQSSDDDDIDIDVLELERSLDEILNDADPGDDDANDNGEDDDDECDERVAGCVGVSQVQIGDEKTFGVNGEIGGEGLADEKGSELASVEVENGGGDVDGLDSDVESRRSDGAEDVADDDDDDNDDGVVDGVAKEEFRGGGNLPLQEDLQSSPHSSVQSSTTELVRSSPGWEFRRRIDGFEEDGNRVSRVGGDVAEAGGMMNRRLHTSSSEFLNVLSGRTGVARGTRVGPRPGAALALAAAASRQVGRSTSVALQKPAIAEYGDLKHNLDNSDVIHAVELPTSEDNPGDSKVEINSVDTEIGKNRVYALGNLDPGLDNFESFTGTSVQLKSNGLDESSISVRYEDGKNEERNSLNEVERWADDSDFRSDLQQPRLSDFPELVSSQEHISDVNLQGNKEMGLLLNTCEEIQAEEEMEADVQRLHNLIGSIDKSDTTSADSSSSSSGEGEASSGMDEPSFDEDSDEAGSRNALAQQISLGRKGKHVDAALRMHNPELDAQVVEESSEKEPAHQPTPFDLAEELEKRNASSGLHWEEGAAAQPMQLEGIQRGPPAIGLLQLESAGTLSHALASATVRRDHGSPQALAVHANFIAVGLSKGAVLVTPSKYSATRSADEMDPTKAVLLGGVTDKVGAAVTSLCFNQQGDLLLVGYANGALCLWDVSRQSVTKVAEHTLAIVHTLFLGQDAPAARYFRAISGDCKGKVALHMFSQQMLPLLRRFSVTTQVLLDGPRTGTVLSVSPLLLDEEFRATGGINPAQQGGASPPPPTLGSVMGGVMGGVVGGVGAVDVGRKFLYDGANSTDEGVGGMVVFVTHQTVLVVRLVPSLEVCSKLSRPTGIRDGAIAYTAWRRIRGKVGASGSMVSNNGNADLSSASSGIVSNGHLDRGHFKEDHSNVVKDMFDNDDLPVLAMAWDKKMIIAQLTKSELRIVREWELDTPAVGLAWLEEQMLVVVTAKDQLCLFTKEGCEVERASLGREEEGLGALTFHTHMTNSFGNPEKAHHGSLSVRGAALYLLGPSQLWRARLLPWRERIKALQDAGDWMGAFHIAMELFDGRARGVTGLPRGLDAMREAIMSTLLALLSAYIDEAFEYLSLAFAAVSVPPLDHTSGANRGRQSADMGAVLDVSEHEEVVGSGQEMLEAREQYSRVGGVAIEFCVHIGKQDVLFESVFSKFESVGQRGTFLELLEPYILKDMLGGLAPEVMQALVQHYSQHGWLERVEQCVLHMDIASLDFNQVVKICREHGLYSALIYLFNKGLDDFRSPLEELMTVAKQTPIASQAHLVGYKLLIYMKYCFSGLAFPPGHGSLPVNRLPGLREEILQFLLDGEVQSQMSSNIEEASLYPRLLYLLRLDTQATLAVLGYAFPENGPLGIGKYGSAYLPDINNGDLVGVISEDVDDGVRYVQAVVNASIEILNASKRDITDLSIITEKSEDIEHNWPSNEDVGSLLDFVAQFVASRHAVVQSSTFMRILEYLASSTPGCKNAKVREDLMVTLLSTVPDSNMDASHILLLAQESKFWQVCALLHTRAGNHEAALDDYLRDRTRLSRPFTFITQMLGHKDGLQGPVMGNFREAVLARVPQFMHYSSMGTLWIILQHFSNENHRIIIELESYPQLLFAYMKGIMNVCSGSHSLPVIGLENVATKKSNSNGEPSNVQRFSTVGGSLQWLPDVNFRDLLHRSKLEITDEMVELYVKLLCQFEPGSVLKFLESYENYRLEHCLKLCQEYGINDAAIFLLERVGDVASALALVLVDLDKCQQALELCVSTFANSAVQAPLKDDAWFMNIPEVAAVKLAVAVGVALCQRNTQRLEPQESISLWFRLLDRVVEPSGRSFKTDTKHGDVYDSISCSRQGSKHAGRSRATRKKTIAQGKVASRYAKGAILKKVFVLIMESIIDGMMGYVPLHYIMEKILADHGTHPFGDFRPTILNMLSAYGYECTILGTAKRIIEEDTFYNITSLRRGCTHSYAALACTCCICGLGLDDDTNKGHARAAMGSSSRNLPKGKAGDKDTGTAIVASYGFSIFHCGHAAHTTCIDGNGPSREESGCPICSLKAKSSSFSSLAKKAISKGEGSGTEVGNDAPGQPKLKTYLRGTGNTSYYSSVTVSRLEVLKQLQDCESLSVLGPSLELHLAPPRKYRPRSTPVLNSSSTSRSRPTQRTSVLARR